MRLKIYEATPFSAVPPKRFALFPTIVKQAHPELDRRWIVWLEWYEIGGKSKWLIMKDL